MAGIDEFRNRMENEKTKYLWRYWSNPGKAMSEQEHLVIGMILKERGEDIELPVSPQDTSEEGQIPQGSTETGTQAASVILHEASKSDIIWEQLLELRQISGKLDKQNEELSKVVSRLGLIVFFFIVVPVAVGFCSVVTSGL